jgi:hypothetical protein
MAPVVAPGGTVAVMVVDEVTVNGAGTMSSPTVTRLAPVKLVPKMVTAVPTGPLMGPNVVMVGRGPTGSGGGGRDGASVKMTPLFVAGPPNVTTCTAAAAPAPTTDGRPLGTKAWMVVGETTVNRVVKPPINTQNAVVKLDPRIVTGVPAGPLEGVMDVTVGKAYGGGAGGGGEPSGFTTRVAVTVSMSGGRPLPRGLPVVPVIVSG